VDSTIGSFGFGMSSGSNFVRTDPSTRNGALQDLQVARLPRIAASKSWNRFWQPGQVNTYFVASESDIFSTYLF
jgi:hypothetical protein